MIKKLKSLDILEGEIENTSKELTESHYFFEYISQFDFGAKDVISMVNVEKYDDLTKDFDGVNLCIALKKRVEIIHDIDYANHIRKESYDDNECGYDNISEDEFLKDKEERLFETLSNTIEHLQRIFYSEAVTNSQSDLKYLRGAGLLHPIKTIDMNYIAFNNRYSGFMGGMYDEEYNRIISRMLLPEPDFDAFTKVLSIPDGYGWDCCDLSKRSIWAEVDLNSSDEVLIEAFKNWLPKARDLHNKVFSEERGAVKSKFKKSLLKKWKELRVIAYLDMRILAEYFQQSPTMKQYADAVYHDLYDIDTTEKVRKTLLPVINDIMDGYCLDDLMRQIQAEGKLF